MYKYSPATDTSRPARETAKHQKTASEPYFYEVASPRDLVNRRKA